MKAQPPPIRMAQRAPVVMICLVAIGAGCARNPQSAPTLIPAPLVSALVDDRGSPAPPATEYAVGKLPRGYPAALVPSGPVNIIGGMTSGDRVVAVFADSTRRLAAVLEPLFEQAGFARPAPTRGSGFNSGSGPYSHFCGDSGTVSATPLTGANRALVRVDYQRMHGRAACRPFERAVSERQLELPELRPPPGVHVAGSQGGSGSEGVTSSADITGTSLVPSAILAHYSSQLVAAGWTGAAPAIGERVAAQFFEAKDASGATWQGVLMATGSSTALTVSLAMHLRTNP